METREITKSLLLQQSDTDIWILFKNGNNDAFAIIYYRYFNLLLLKGLQICIDKELVKDSIHDLFVEIWASKENLSVPDSVKAYLISSIKRKVLFMLKKIRSARVEIGSMPSEVVRCKEDQLISEQYILEQQYTVRMALKFLTKRQREVIELKYFENLSYEEIANRMSIHTDSIYNLVSKAMGNLEKELGKIAGSRVC